MLAKGTCPPEKDEDLWPRARFGFFSCIWRDFLLKDVQQMYLTSHHNLLIQRLKPKFPWKLRVERSKVSYTSAMAACEKAKIGQR